MELSFSVATELAEHEGDVTLTFVDNNRLYVMALLSA